MQFISIYVITKTGDTWGSVGHSRAIQGHEITMMSNIYR